MELRLVRSCRDIAGGKHRGDGREIHGLDACAVAAARVEIHGKYICEIVSEPGVSDYDAPLAVPVGRVDGDAGERPVPARQHQGGPIDDEVFRMIETIASIGVIPGVGVEEPEVSACLEECCWVDRPVPCL